MKVELLPNEIFLNLFHYLNGVDLLQAFYGLNSRFSFLLHNQYRDYRFDLTSISKRTFDQICQQHMPLISHGVLTLSLSSLSHIHSFELLFKLSLELHSLSNLTHLYLSECHCQISQTNFQRIMNCIWRLPKLLHCTLDVAYTEQSYFYAPTTTISTSLKHLTLYGSKLQLDGINRLFEHTPRLTRLVISVDFLNNDDDDDISSPLPTLLELDLRTYYKSFHSTSRVFLENLPNLRRLSVDLSSELIDGYRWERLIRHYLPKLERFQLKMKETLSLVRHISEQVDVLMDSFRSSFWIDEHQRFIRCITRNNTIYVHTVSTASNYYDEKIPDSWRSTDPFDDPYEYYSILNEGVRKVLFSEQLDNQYSTSNCS